MPQITVNNATYDFDTLSEDAKTQVANLRFVDQELARIDSQAAVLRTARMTYGAALQAALPAVAPDDTAKLN